MALWMAGCATLPQDAVRRIQKAQEDYTGGRYGDARRMLNLVIASHPQTPGVGEAYYLRGLCSYRERQDEEARGDLEMALKTSRRPELQAKAQAQLGHLWYQRGDFSRAVPHYAQALKNYPRGPSAAELYYRYGDSLQRVGQWKKSREILPKVWHLFPESNLVSYARMKFSWPHDYFVVQCGSFDRSDLAQQQARRLQRAGWEAVVEVDLRREKTRHVVHVGRHSRYEAAEAQLVTLRSRVADAFVVP